MRQGSMRGGLVTCAALALMVAWAWSAHAQAAGRVQTVPLGGSISGQRGDKAFGVYVPTRFGGNLTIRSSQGKVEALSGPDGRPRTNGEDVGTGAHGWYTFRVVGTSGPYTVSSEFVQVAQAKRMPWNYYYWPTKSDTIHEPFDGTGDGIANTQAVGGDIQVVPVGTPVSPGQDIVRPGPDGILKTLPAPGDTLTWFPNLSDDLTFRGADGTVHSGPAPLLKYDQLFGTNARAWEAAAIQTHDMARWTGHCLGGAVASIMLNDPEPAPGSGMTKDELKALWCELGENHLNHQIGDNVNNIPAGPPRPGPDPTDAFVPRFHAVLETNIRGHRKALLANLRGFPPSSGPHEVWNNGVGKYVAKYHAVPGRGERSVRIEMVLTGNTGSDLDGSDPEPRVNTYEYIVVYGLNGEVDESQPHLCDWIAVGGQAMYAPMNVMEVLASHWQGHNLAVNEANVRALDLANGGAGGRFASGPAPTFRPVAVSEAGQTMFAGGGGGGGIFGGGSYPVSDGLNYGGYGHGVAPASAPSAERRSVFARMLGR